LFAFSISNHQSFDPATSSQCSLTSRGRLTAVDRLSHTIDGPRLTHCRPSNSVPLAMLRINDNWSMRQPPPSIDETLQFSFDPNDFGLDGIDLPSEVSNAYDLAAEYQMPFSMARMMANSNRRNPDWNCNLWPTKPLNDGPWNHVDFGNAADSQVSAIPTHIPSPVTDSGYHSIPVEGGSVTSVPCASPTLGPADSPTALDRPRKRQRLPRDSMSLTPTELPDCEYCQKDGTRRSFKNLADRK